ncbi:carrier protein [Angomonas deanei]|nr:carrier protein [Angomonas deanei]|eukprot:EPY39515.1 carrier protein [Angomonas deanei]
MSDTKSEVSAVTRGWSDVNPIKMMMTFAATSFTYSFLGQPLFLVIARQQCCKTPISASDVFWDVIKTCGWKGLYRGVGASVTGTVLCELVYYFVVEYGKEHLPMKDRRSRSFASGLLADICCTPVFNPFGVVSQVQMVAGSMFSVEHNYMSAWRTTTTLVREQGVRCLFKGTLLTFMAAPLTGAWWFIYETFKSAAYNCAPYIASLLSPMMSPSLISRLPHYMVSHTDNALINMGVGALSSVVLGFVMNPIYVLRLRLQVEKTTGTERFPALRIVKETLRHEGPRALYKGLGINLLMAGVGGCAFGATYEGAKQFSDKGVDGEETDV